MSAGGSLAELQSRGAVHPQGRVLELSDWRGGHTDISCAERVVGSGDLAGIGGRKGGYDAVGLGAYNERAIWGLFAPSEF